MNKTENFEFNLPNRDNPDELADINVISENFEKADEILKEHKNQTNELLSVVKKGFYYKYDFNGDGVVDFEDCNYLQGIVDGSNSVDSLPWWTISDVNGDGEFTEEDVMSLNDMLEANDPAAFAEVPKTELIDVTLNGTSKKPIQNKAVSQGVANALKGTASGSAVALKDVSPLEHNIGVKVASKNLLDLTSIIGKTVTLNGGTLSCGADGGITGSGFVTGYMHIYSKSYTLPVDTYTLSISGNCKFIGCAYTIQDKDRTILATGTVEPDLESLPINLADYPTYNDIVFEIKRTANNVEMSGTAYFQLEKGTTATKYSPFVPIEDVTLAKYGKNLFDENKDYDVGILEENGEKIFYNTNTAQAEYLRFDITEIWDLAYSAGVKLSVSFDLKTQKAGTVNVYALGKKNVDATQFANATTEWQRFRLTFGLKYNTTGDETCRLAFFGGSYGSGVIPYIKNIQIELGDSVSEYEPYKKPVGYLPEKDGTVDGVTSLYPTTTLVTDAEGVTITAEYNRDLNKTIEILTNAIISLGGNV